MDAKDVTIARQHRRPRTLGADIYRYKVLGFHIIPANTATAP
jgi:hypothetical protein